MTCPSCSAGKLAPLTGVCELCGYSARTAVAVERHDVVIERVRQELSHEFDLLEPLGTGPRTAVLAAVERSTGRRVVLKATDRDEDGPEADQRFRAALEQHIALDHPHLVPVTRFGVTDSLRWYTRADLQATSLREVLRQGVRLDARAARRLATQLTSALDYLHRRGIVHGALKPENVLMDRNGWAHLCDPATSFPVLGSRPAWRSPEHFGRGEHSPAADQYALAALLAEALIGAPVEGGEVLGQLAHANVPPHTAAAIARALADEPRDRFSSLSDLVWALEAGTPPVSDARPGGKTNSAVMFIADWQPSRDPLRLQRIARRILATIGVLLGLAMLASYGIPILDRIVRPQPTSAAFPIPGAAGAVSSPPAPRGDAPAVTTPPASRVIAPTVAAPLIPAAPAKLFVNSTPWGEVFLDGRLLGNTPRTNIDLRPGSHVIRVERDGFQPFESRVTVRSGQTLRLTDIVLAPRRP